MLDKILIDPRNPDNWGKAEDFNDVGVREDLEMKKMDAQDQKTEMITDDFDDHDDVLRKEPPEGYSNDLSDHEETDDYKNGFTPAD